MQPTGTCNLIHYLHRTSNLLNRGITGFNKKKLKKKKKKKKIELNIHQENF